MSHRPMDFEEMDRLFSYDAETGEIRNKVDRGVAGAMAKAGAIATCRSSKGYLQVQVTKDGRRTCYKAHRVAWLLHYREDPGEMQIDHVDRDRKNNRISNLRLVNHQGNMMNLPKRSDNTSDVTGVGWHKANGKWQVRIADRGKEQYLGIFTDKFEAICARKSAENRLGYHENHGK